MTEPGRSVVAPTRDDALVASSADVVGGPLGAHAAPGWSWWTPIRVLVALTCCTVALGWLAKAPCRAEGWPDRATSDVWVHQCYSDLPYLYRERGLVAGAVPYLDPRGAPQLEYPVLTGAAFGVAAVVARATLPAGTGVDDQAVRFYDVMALLLLGAALVTVVATARTVPRRPYDAALVAASPVLALTATINADLLAVALVALAVLAWTRDRPWSTGVLLGLGAATKLYPLLLLGPVLLVALRERRPRDAGRAALAALGAWLVVDLPVWLLAPAGFSAFWTFNAERKADFGSVWYALALRGLGVPADQLDRVWMAAFGAACLLVAVLAWRAPRPPRLAQLAFLVVAAFVLLTKVDSPQYALWLLPLAALARPRWRDLLVWQAGELLHFVAVWLWLDGLYHPDAAWVDATGYATAIWVRVGCLLWLVAVVVRDVLAPAHDPVRAAVTA